MKLFGLIIHNGYHAETHVAATMLGSREGRFDAEIVYNCWPGNPQGIDRFRSKSRAEVIPMDTGWRPNDDASRTISERLFSVARIFAHAPHILRVARKFNPDVIYSCQQTWDNNMAAYVARRLGKPHVIHLHCAIEGISPHNRYQIEAVERLKTCTHIIAVSDFIRQCAINYGVPAARVTTVRSPMECSPPPPDGTRDDVRRELGVPGDARLIGIVARLSPWKGQSESIAAFAGLADRYPDARLIITGDGIYDKDLEAQVAERNLADRVIFTGRRADVPRILAALDIFIHPSRGEALGLSMLEASSAGLPVIAYADGGIPEIIRNGETGILVAPNDVPALAKALEDLLDNPVRRHAMGQAGRLFLEREFQVAPAAAAFASVIEGVVRSANAR